MTFTFTVSLRFSYLNLTFAFPVLFFAVITKNASPLTSVVALRGDIDIRFRSDLLILAVTTSPSSGRHPSIGVKVTFTSPSSPLLRTSSLGDANMYSFSHPVGVGIGVGEDVGIGVAVGGSVGVTEVVGVGVTEAVGVGVSVAVGNIVGVVEA